MQRITRSSTSARVRPAVVLPLLLPLLMAGACSPQTVQTGADPATVGPRTFVTPAPPPGSGSGSGPASGTASPGSFTSGASADQLQHLQARLADALRTTDPKTNPSSLGVEQLSYADNQLVITWTVSVDPNDQTAPQRVRGNAITLLRRLKESSPSYSSVVLLAYGAVLDQHGAKTNAQVVRAKYSQGLVSRTDFGAVSPDQVLKLPDDKPADVHPSYR